MFEVFFGTANPHAIALDSNGNQVKMIEKIESDVHKDAITERNQTHEADLTISCECTLEEFFHGSTKELKFERKRLLGDERTVENEIVRKEIEIKPGMSAGTTLRFPGEGNSPSDKLTGDLIINIKQAVNDSYRREGNDLIYRHNISLVEALSCAAIEFKTLDGEIIRYRPDEIVTPQFRKVFAGKGMPIYNQDPLSPLMLNHDRGNFILTF